MLDKDTLFNLFDQSEQIEEHQTITDIEINKEQLKLQIFCKLIINRKNLQKSLSLLGENTGIVENKLESLADAWVYLRAFDYIKSFKIEFLKEIFESKVLDIHILIDSLQKAIKYFEQLEYYENCAILFNIQREIKETQVNVI